jgi:polysaccharide export outer membrane protein
MKYFGGVGFLLAALTSAALAQVPRNVPPPSQAAQTLQNAVQQRPSLDTLIRQRIAQSGMTPDQIRSLLQARGYSRNLLDQFMGPQAPGQAAPTAGANELMAIQAIGLLLPSVAPESLPVDTGMIAAARRAAAMAQPAESVSFPYVFGTSVFRRTTTQFLPMLAGPVPPDYRIGPGDNLVLILTGDVEQAYSLPVTREGFILIPQVGQVFVSNLTLEQLRSLLYTRLGRVYSGIRRGTGATTHFDISVANVGAIQVFVVGEVAQPGAYQISALGTAMTALYAAGGVTDIASTRRIEVRRGGQLVSHLDLYDYLLRGDTHNDVRLQTGDVVFVPIHGTRAMALGAVRRPAIYELKDGETLPDLIADAGGLRADAAAQRISIHRILPFDQRAPGGPQHVTVDVPLGRPPADSGAAATDTGVIIPRFPLQDGDSVIVDTITSAGKHTVQIQGNVYQPGRYGLEREMRLSRLVGLAGGLKPATYAGRAHIDRLNQADSTRSIIPAVLPADSTQPWTDDPLLQDYDSVTIYGRTEMRDSLYVTVSGMVNEPAKYPWREGMTLRDLVLEANGLQIGAFLGEAEIARLPADRSHGELATTIRVPMDSTYLFDRDSLGRPIGPPGMPFRASGAPEAPLDPYDAVLILRQPDFELQRTVDVTGEVRFPGTYALRSKSDRLSEIIERAGGLTPRAYPEGVRFVRALGAAGRINVDLAQALRDTASTDNVIMQPGDSIEIPEYEPTVRVVGAVNSPGSVLWQPGLNLDDYLHAAGGLGRYAVSNRVSVRYANGRTRTRHKVFLFFSSSPTPGPGSTVLVPARDPNDRTDYVALIGSLAQTLASSLAILLVIMRL